MTTISPAPKRTVRRANIGNDFERRAYFFMRMSGISLLILAVGHVFIQLVLNDVHNLTLAFVADQWDDWGWKIYDMLLLFLALPHGINGLRNILEDYIHNERTLRVIRGLLVAFLVFALVYAAAAIIFFDPAQARDVAETLAPH
ncbi:MAG TPA: succinate dehydrogenase [Anaerolineae bacterium]|nr:succinate dehydrogenase [Anaerolineae bacterium]